MVTAFGTGETPQRPPTAEQILSFRSSYAPEPFSRLPEENIPVRSAILGSYSPVNPAARVSDFEGRFPDLFAAMKVVGAHPLQPAELPNPYDPSARLERFANVGLHMVQTAMIVEPLAMTLLIRGVISHAEAFNAHARALAHDLNKPAEIARRNAASVGRFSGNPYSDEAYAEQAELLSRMGVGKRMGELIAASGTDTGHGSFKSFITLHDGAPGVRVRGNWVAALVHLADAMAYSTKPQAEELLGEKPIFAVVTPLDRMILANFESARPKLGYPWMWEKGLGVNRHGMILDVENIHAPPAGIMALGNYAYFQPRISECICRELKAAINPSSDQEPEEFVRQLVQEWIEESDRIRRGESVL